MRKKQGKRKNIYYQAQAILARRDHAEAEVRLKLARKQFSEPEIQEAITWLYSQRLLDDDRFARAYAESVLLRKPVGRRYIAAQLKQKRTKESSIAAALDHVFSQHSEQDLAQDAAERWKRIHPNVENSREKLYRFLTSRGFSIDVISEVLGDV